MFRVTDLQSTEPSALSHPPDGVSLAFDVEKDSMGFDRVTVTADTPAQLLAYVEENWGDDDPQWWAEHVVARVEEVEGGFDPPDTRTILAHLNIEVPKADPRTPEQIADAFLAVSLDSLDGSHVSLGTYEDADGAEAEGVGRVSVPLVEEV